MAELASSMCSSAMVVQAMFENLSEHTDLTAASVDEIAATLDQMSSCGGTAEALAAVNAAIGTLARKTQENAAIVAESLVFTYRLARQAEALSALLDRDALKRQARSAQDGGKLT